MQFGEFGAAQAVEALGDEILVLRNHRIERLLAGRRQAHEMRAPVMGRRLARDEALGHEPVDEAGHVAVRHHEPARKFAHGEAFLGAVDTAVLFKEQAAKAGIDINIVREPDDGYWTDVWLKKPFVGSYWAGRPTCDWMFTLAYAADALWNETFWKHPRFNELLIQGRSETDEAKRAAIYAEMQQLVHDDGGPVNLVFNSYVSATDARLGHGEVASNWPDDGARLIERWWFEA